MVNLPDFDGVAAFTGLFPNELAVFVDKSVGDLIESALVCGLEAASQCVNNSVTTCVEAVAVGGASRHSPIDAAAQIASIHACCVQSFDGVIVGVDNLIMLVYVHATVNRGQSRLDRKSVV